MAPMATAGLCCTHIEKRIDSPEPPSRLPSSIDAIFAAAVLPEDHPDAPTILTHRKSSVDIHDILRSPKLVQKLRANLRRKSGVHVGKGLRKEDSYDKDAMPMTSLEIVHRVGEHDDAAANGKNTGSVDAVQLDGAIDWDGLHMNPSGASGLYMLQTHNELSPNFTELGETNGDGQPTIRITPASPVVTSPLYKSFSTPNLLSNVEPTPTQDVRRSFSSFGLGSSLTIPRVRPRVDSMVQDALESASLLAEICEESQETVTPDAPKANDDSINNTVRHGSDNVTLNADGDCVTKDVESARAEQEDQVPHLHAMDIHAQLRSMSQLSGSVDGESIATSHQPWTFHRRERSDIGSLSLLSRHTRQDSNAYENIDPFAVSRVQSPAASSMYSRPSSTIHVRPLSSLCEPLADDSASGDWPLTSTPIIPAMDGAMDVPALAEIEPTENNNALIITTGNTDQSCPNSMATLPKERSVSFLTLPVRDCSTSRKSNSTTGTKQSKTSRFFEHFSPPKKSVKKRRSMFKFLRPGSRKHQHRSLSTSNLGPTTHGPLGGFDGPSEDTSLLTVQYDLSDEPSRPVRAASMNYLGPYQKESSESRLDIPIGLERRPSMADYERHLSIAGDDRRRPSNVGFLAEKAIQVQQEERKDSLHLKRRSTRAVPLNDDPKDIMFQALAKHQDEKALFRSVSKARESLAASGHDVSEPILLTGPGFGPSSSSTTLPHGRRPTEWLDPLDNPHTETGPLNDSLSRPSLLVPRGASPGVASKKRASSVAVTSTASFLTKPQRKIGTSLTSWSRYPSHTRAVRSASAGRADDIIARDFAIDKNPINISSEYITEPNSPNSKTTGKRSKISLPKSHSTMLDGIIRYYSNIFAYGSNQNRRSSVATGGWLEHPDLEMLPPVHAADSANSHHHHHHHLSQQLRDFEEHLKEDLEIVEAEAGKLMHHHARDQKADAPTFRAESPFQGSSQHSHHLSVAVGPEDDLSEDPLGGVNFEAALNNESRETASRTTVPDKEPADDDHEEQDSISEDPAVETLEPNYHQMDGADDTSTHFEKTTPTFSRAEFWSGIYKTCIERSDSISSRLQNENTPLLSKPANTVADEKKGMQPPNLRPVKPRSPEARSQKILDPKSSIRKFPSVTVVDDLKGHSRSVSLISVRADSLSGIVRSSTNDLIQLIQAREKEEREKLLKNILSESIEG